MVTNLGQYRAKYLINFGTMLVPRVLILKR
jgi:hypothetical protein